MQCIITENYLNNINNDEIKKGVLDPQTVRAKVEPRRVQTKTSISPTLKALGTDHH